MTSPSEEVLTSRIWRIGAFYPTGPEFLRIKYAFCLKSHNVAADAGRSAHPQAVCRHHSRQCGGPDRPLPGERGFCRRNRAGGFRQQRCDDRNRPRLRRPGGAAGLAGVRAAETIRRRPGQPRLGSVPRCGRSLQPAPAGQHRAGAAAARLPGLSHAAPQPLPGALACARRGLSGLEPAPVPARLRALERRPGARESHHRRAGGQPARRSAARIGRRSGRLSGQAEPLHDAAGAKALPRGPARARRPAAAQPAAALLPVLCLAARLSRWRAGAGTHPHRLFQQPDEICKTDGFGQGDDRVKVLVTGAAGFIGMHVALRLLERGDEVVGVDSLNDYYDVKLKQDRLARLTAHGRFSFAHMDLTRREAAAQLFAAGRFQGVAHLAAQPGVRYSLKNPHAYVDSNIVAFLNVLEGCRHHAAEHLVYASSSSVYGANTRMPFSVHDNVDHPVSLYAATKKANELMAHTYSHLYRLPTTGLRFFTVYGPWGRPDMSPSLFTGAILAGRPIDVFNHGRMRRDFTYIDDIVEGVVRVLDRPAAPDPGFDRSRPDPAASDAPYRVYNIGNHEPVELMAFIEAIEQAAGKKALKNMLPMQAGDVEATYADTEALREAVGFAPRTPLSQGVAQFVAWYKSYYGAAGA